MEGLDVAAQLPTLDEVIAASSKFSSKIGAEI